MIPRDVLKLTPVSELSKNARSFNLLPRSSTICKAEIGNYTFQCFIDNIFLNFKDCSTEIRLDAVKLLLFNDESHCYTNL